MIVDTFENLCESKFRAVFEKIQKFVETATPDMPNGRYEIDGDAIFALVSRYETKSIAKGRMEYHRKYADIQMLLDGEEYIYYTPMRGLTISEPFSEENDIGFTDAPNALLTSIALYPGMMAVLEPHDGHMPQIRVCEENATSVVKVVIKVDAERLR